LLWASAHKLQPEVLCSFSCLFRVLENPHLIVSEEAAVQHVIMNEALMVHLIVLFNFHFVWATLVIGKYGLIIIGIRLLERERVWLSYWSLHTWFFTDSQLKSSLFLHIWFACKICLLWSLYGISTVLFCTIWMRWWWLFMQDVFQCLKSIMLWISVMVWLDGK